MKGPTPMSDFSERDAEDDAEARRWAEEVRREAAESPLVDDAAFLERKLAEERSKLTRK